MIRLDEPGPGRFQFESCNLDSRIGSFDRLARSSGTTVGLVETGLCYKSFLKTSLLEKPITRRVPSSLARSAREIRALLYTTPRAMRPAKTL